MSLILKKLICSSGGELWSLIAPAALLATPGVILYGPILGIVYAIVWYRPCNRFNCVNGTKTFAKAFPTAFTIYYAIMICVVLFLRRVICGGSGGGGGGGMDMKSLMAMMKK